jgi:hypothetical protein
VSDPNPNKTVREREQAKSFLLGRGMPFQSVDAGSDPPDVNVRRAGLPPLDIEITSYHPENDRVGMEKRANQFRALFDDLMRQSPKLKGVSIGMIFHDSRMPGDSRHSQIASEMIRCVEHAVDQGWVIDTNLNISFAENYFDIEDEWFVLPSADWPLLAQHVNVLQLSRFPWDGYLPTNNFYAQAAYSSPYPDAFLKLLTKKEESVRDAIQKRTYVRGHGPLWLLILSNIPGDLASHVYGDPWLRSAVDDSGFDFGNSVFDEVWLMDLAGGGRSRRLYPWETLGGGNQSPSP